MPGQLVVEHLADAAPGAVREPGDGGQVGDGLAEGAADAVGGGLGAVLLVPGGLVGDVVAASGVGDEGKGDGPDGDECGAAHDNGPQPDPPLPGPQFA